MIITFTSTILINSFEETKSIFHFVTIKPVKNILAQKKWERKSHNMDSIDPIFSKIHMSFANIVIVVNG